MGIFDPQGLPSSPTSQSSTNSGIASWAQPYVMNMLNQGNSLLNQGPTDLQNQVYASSANMQTPGQFAQGTNLLNQSGQGMLGTTGTALGYGQQASGAGQAYQNMATDPNQMAAYMNPYIQQALAPQLQLLNQQQALQGQNIAAKAAGQGAFGGNRAALSQGLNQQNYALAGQQAIGQGYSDAFKQAQQAQQFGADLGLRGLNTALQGVNTAQQGYAGATQAGSALGNLGAQQGQYDTTRLGLQNTIANQQYNLPFQRLQFMQGLMQGLPVSTSTTQGYQAGPNKLSQGAGAVGALASYAPSIVNGAKNVWNYATSGGAPDVSQITPDQWASGNFAKGGQVKHYAEGGIASINREVMNDPTAYSEQTINRSAQDNVLGGVTKLLALDTIAKQRAAMQAQQQMQAQPQQPIFAQLQQQAMPQQMAQGIDSAQSNLPQQYAGGGIIAFNGTEQSDVPAPKGYFDTMLERLGKARQNVTTLPSEVPTLFGIPLWGAANKEVVAKELAPAPTEAKPDELGRYKAGADTSGIIIHDNAPRVAGPAVAPTVPQMPPQAPRDYGAAGIDALTKGYESMITGGEDFKKAESDAERSAFRKSMFDLMAGKSPYFFTNAGEAGSKYEEGLEKTKEGIQARKDKQIGQLAALGLKGAELKAELQKLGVTEDYYKAHYPLLAAQAKYYGAKGVGGGAGGISAGTIGAKDYWALKDKYTVLSSNPKSDPAFYATLPKKVQDALKATPGTDSYQRGLEAVKQITDKMMAQDINEARAVGAKKVPLSSIED